MNRLLERQIKKFFVDKNLAPREIWPFLDAVSSAYDGFEGDLKMMERSFDLSFQEMNEVNQELKRLVGKTRQAKDRLEGSSKTLKSIIDSLPFGVFIVDMEKKIVVANKEAVKISGYDAAEDLLGRSCNTCLCSAEDGKCPVLDLKQTIDKSEKELITRDGKRIPILKSIIPIKLGGKDVLLEGFIDLSDHKKAKKEKEKLELQLIQAQKLETIGSMAGGIAHDFNNMLGIILGYAEIIKKETPEDSPINKNIQQLLKASQYGRDLVAQILTFTRHSEPRLRRLKMQTVLDEALKLLRASLPSTIKIETDIDPACDDIYADSTQIKQVIANLCTNAGHSMSGKGGVLSMKMEMAQLDQEFSVKHPTAKPGSYVKFSVSDTGHGMDKNTIEKIFEPFFTTKNSKGGPGGVGLGLSVTYGIVTQIGGTITVYSDPGKGSVFHVYLPVAGDRKDLPEGGTEAICDDTMDVDIRGSETVLFVDDEEQIVIVGKKMLEKLGYNVIGANDSRVALQQFKDAPHYYDVVITDQVMPYITGKDLAEEILRIRPGMPIIIATGFSDAVTRENYKKFGISEYLMKPLTIQDLCRAIRKVVPEKK